MSSEKDVGLGPLIRIIRTPHFLDKKGGLKPSAFRPARETPYISIVRWITRERPENRLKQRCQDVGNVGENKYCGVAVFSEEDCQASGLGIVPAEEEFPGHYHLVSPVVSMRDEPPDGVNFKIQAEASHKMRLAAKFIADPEPQSAEWTIRTELLVLD